MPGTVSYVTVDVFTDEKFAGNPLAVIPDARGLSGEAMQRIAAEFNYSESTFVFPPEDPANTARVCIFTPTTEVPFAGHPNVGTAFVLGRQPEIFGKAPDDMLRFEEKAGLVDVTLRRVDGAITGAAIVAPKPLQIGASPSAELVSRCVSLDVEKIAQDRHAPVFASVGLQFAFAEITDMVALADARPNLSVFSEAALLHSSMRDFSLFLYVRDKERPWHIRARMFAPLDNVIEDPATGSASGALGAYLVSLLSEHTAQIDITIEQGVEMGRRSVIDLCVSKIDGIVEKVTIAGNCVDVMRGEIEI